MQFRTLGKTGLRVSRLAFGGSSLGDPRKQVSDEESLLAVRAALEAGINLIDVSPYYGKTRAEQIVGQAIRDTPRDQVIIATKAGRNSERDFDFSSAGLRRSVEQSLKRLGTDYIDILQLHDIEYAAPEQIIDESLPTLQQLKAEGIARFIGVTAYPIETLRHVIENVSIDTVLSYCHYCLSDTSLESLRPLADRHGIGMMSASPFAMGLLTKAGPYPWHPATQPIRDTCRTAVQYAEERGEDIAKLALQFACQADWVPTTVVGGSSPGQILKNLEWAQVPIDRTLLDEVLRILKPIHDQAWNSAKRIDPSEPVFRKAP